MTLSLVYEQCVRTRSRAIDCQICVEACPTDAISLTGDGSVSVALDGCIACGLCHGACPTEAFGAPYDEAAALDAFDGILTCGAGDLPCVAALATEVLVTLGLRHDDVILEVIDDCPSVAGHGMLGERVEAANRALQALGRAPVSVRAGAPSRAEAPEPEAPEAGRRRFFRTLVGAERREGKGQLTWSRRIDRSLMRRLPPRRIRLREALVGRAAVEPLSGEPGFTSAKHLDPETCTVCTICVSICPTGALQAGRGWRSVRFDASACVKCGLCHAACAPEALTLTPMASLDDFVVGGHRILSALPTRSCRDCGRRHHRDEGRDGLCPSCAAMEDDAFDLTGLR